MTSKWWLRFRGIGTLTALGLIAEIGDFASTNHHHDLNTNHKNSPKPAGP
jgi:hypothetical protein